MSRERSRLSRLARAFGADLAAQGRLLAASYLFRFAAVVAAVLAPWPLKIIIDNVIASRPLPAGPEMPTPGAQLHGIHTARLHLLAGADAVDAQDAELGLRATFGGACAPACTDALLELRRNGLVLSALKPASGGDGFIVRVLNPTNGPLDAELRLGVPFVTVPAVRLDEQPERDTVVERAGRAVTFGVPPLALRSVWLRS